MSSTYFHEDKVQQKMSYFGLFVRLWPRFMQYKLSFFTILTSMVGMVVTARMLPTLFGRAIDEGVVKNHYDVIVRIAIIYFALVLIKSTLTFIHTYLFSKMGNRILYDIRQDLIQHVQSLPIAFFDKTPTGRIVTRLTNDVISLGDLFTEGLISVFTNVLSVVAILIAMLAISPKLTLYTLSIAPLMLWLCFSISNRIQDILREIKKKLALINAFVAENLNGIKVLHLHNRTHKNERKFQEYSAEYKNLQLKTVHLYALLWPNVTLFYGIGLAIALYFGSFLTHKGILGIGSLIAFAMHVQDFFPPLRGILEKYQQFQNSLTGAERIFTVLAETPEDLSGHALPDARLRGRIDIRNLTFRYGPNLPEVLKDISLDIESGQSLAIVGRTGSGKSTLIALLQRFYDTDSGQILLDGIPIKDISRQHLRARIAVVQQDPFTFRGTIAENISLFNPLMERKRIEDAVRKAYAWDMVQRHGGLDGHVQERGANLSLGERQLLAFARILAHDPDILILDEATANVDSQNEYRIQQATRRVTQGRTSIVIAHRLSTILDCDRIVVLDQGQIAEQGRHEDLLAAKGLYAQLYAHHAQKPSVAFTI